MSNPDDSTGSRCSRRKASSSASATSSASPVSTLSCTRARCWPSSATTAPASRRSSSASRERTCPTPERSSSTAQRWSSRTRRTHAAPASRPFTRTWPSPPRSTSPATSTSAARSGDPGFLGSALRLLDKKGMRRRAQEQVEALGITTLQSMTQAVETFSGGQRQAVAVARSAAFGSKVVILDEPTAALGVRETAQVLRLVRDLRDQGLPVIIISHDMPAVFEVADRIQVQRLGRRAAVITPDSHTRCRGRRHHDRRGRRSLKTGSAMLLVVGEALVDVVEQPDGKRNEHAGGSPTNVAVGLGRVGLDVTFATALADDAHGELIRWHLAESRVNVLASAAERTSSAVARLDKHGSASYEFDVAWDPGPINAERHPHHRPHRLDRGRARPGSRRGRGTLSVACTRPRSSRSIRTSDRP